MNIDNKFKLGDKIAYFRCVRPIGPPKYRGELIEIIEATEENGYSCDELRILMNDGGIFSDCFYTFDYDIEVIREDKINNLIGQVSERSKEVVCKTIWGFPAS